MSQLLEQVPVVDIDGHGTFKYILIKVTDEKSAASKNIVRGYARAQWHSDILQYVKTQLEDSPGLQLDCLGGGRISHDPDEKTLRVYGYSVGYGKADHTVSVELLKQKYSDYTITFSDEGY